jgi:hypothetical protein
MKDIFNKQKEVKFNLICTSHRIKMLYTQLIVKLKYQFN